MDDYNPRNRGGSFRARPYGSSSVAVTIAVVVLVGALLAAAAFVVFRGGDDNDQAAEVVGTSTVTAAAESLLPTATSPASTASPTATESPTASAPPPATTTPVPPTETEEAVEPTATSEATEVETEPPATEAPDVQEPTTAPTSEVEAPAEPTEEPASGEFGQLPAPQLPSGGASTTLSLDYQLGLSLENLPAAGTVYQIGWPVLTIDQAQAMADQLGIQGEVAQLGNGTFEVSGEAGYLYISPLETVYQSSATGEGAAPTESEALSVALQWLLSTGLVGDNNDGGVVIATDDATGNIVTRFQPAEPSPILSPIPGATVTVGAGGTVVEAQIHWQNTFSASDYGFSAPINLWEAVASGQGYLEADLSGVDASSGLTGTATMTSYSIAYTIAGGPSIGHYLTPVIVFEGTARIDQTGAEVPVSVSVSAVYDQAGSSG